MEAITGRGVKSGKEYEYLFPPPTGNDIVIKKSADVSDTVRFIQEKVPLIKWQTEKFAEFIKGSTPEETCLKIWHWVYEHIPYARDEEGIEQIRSPRRAFWDRFKIRLDNNGEKVVGVDCDCYTVFISATLQCLGIPHKYRITKYARLDGPRWQHIYIVVPKTGRLENELNNRNDYIVLDCVKDGYNVEQPYLEKKDYNAIMELQFLDGIEGDEETTLEEYEVPDFVDAQDLASVYDEEELGKVGKWLKKTAKKVGKTKVVKKIGKVAGKVIRAVNKVSLIPLRNAFLKAMKADVKNIAQRLRYAYLSDAQATKMGINLSELANLRKIKDKAETIYWQAGGSKSALAKAIVTGKGNKDGQVALSGLDGLDGEYADEEERNIVNSTNGFGDLGEPITAASLVAAAGVIATVASSLDKVKNLFTKGSPQEKATQNESGESATKIPDVPPAKEVESNSSQDENTTALPPPPPPPPASKAPTAARLTQGQGLPSFDQEATPAPAPTKQEDLPKVSSLPAVSDKQEITLPATDTPTPKPETKGVFAKAGDWIMKNPVPIGLVAAAGIGVGIYAIVKKNREAQNKTNLNGVPPASGKAHTNEERRKQNSKRRKRNQKIAFKEIKIG
jgi:hypothetical protein